MTKNIPLSFNMTKEIVEAKPVIKDGMAEFEIQLSFAISIDLECWRKTMESRQREAGGDADDWSNAVPNEFYAIQDRIDDTYCFPEAMGEIFGQTMNLLLERQRELEVHWICPDCLANENKAQTSADGPLDLL